VARLATASAIPRHFAGTGVVGALPSLGSPRSRALCLDLEASTRNPVLTVLTLSVIGG